MSQERTEHQVTLEELQREVKGKVGFGPNAERTRILIEGFKKWPESFEQWVDEGNYYGWDVDSFIRIIWEKDEEIDRLNAVITGQAEAIREQTAKVQERDKRMNELAADAYAASEACQSMSEQIERLRAALEQFEKIPIERSNSTAMKMRAMANAALKGAE